MILDFEKAVKSGVEQAMRECELTIGMTLKEAVEKQIPKKPQIKEFPDKGEESGDRYLWTFYICPVCGEHIGLRYNKFCSNCGQALEWGDVE